MLTGGSTMSNVRKLSPDKSGLEAAKTSDPLSLSSLDFKSSLKDDQMSAYEVSRFSAYRWYSYAACEMMSHPGTVTYVHTNVTV